MPTLQPGLVGEQFGLFGILRASLGDALGDEPANSLRCACDVGGVPLAEPVDRRAVDVAVEPGDLGARGRELLEHRGQPHEAEATTSRLRVERASGDVGDGRLEACVGELAPQPMELRELVEISLLGQHPVEQGRHRHRGLGHEVRDEQSCAQGPKFGREPLVRSAARVDIGREPRTATVDRVLAPAARELPGRLERADHLCRRRRGATPEPSNVLLPRAVGRIEGGECTGRRAPARRRKLDEHPVEVLVEDRRIKVRERLGDCVEKAEDARPLSDGGGLSEAAALQHRLESLPHGGHVVEAEPADGGTELARGFRGRHRLRLERRRPG